MPDSPDLTPPPAQPMPDDVRARVSRRLIADVAADRRSRRTTWLVPGLAAAAVLAVVGGTFVVTSLDDHGDGGGTTMQPADDGGNGALVPETTTDATPGASTIQPTAPAGTLQPTSPPETAVPTSPGEATPTSGSTPPGSPAGSCDDEIDSLAQPGFEDAAVTAQRGYGPGATYLYETKSAWIVCDDLAATDGGAPTLLAPHEKSQPYVPNTATLAVSENLITRADGSWAYDQFVAAGRDFDGVQAVSYTFPDGHTQDAVVGVNGLWSMTYLATEGVFMDKNLNTSTLEPIEVDVRYTGGDVETFTLEWGLDTCAQINHGC